MAGIDTSVSPLLADLVAGVRPVPAHDRATELLRLSVDPLLLNALINQTDLDGAVAPPLGQTVHADHFLGRKFIVSTMKCNDRFQIEPLNPGSVRPEAFDPREEIDHREYCSRDISVAWRGIAQVLLVGILTAAYFISHWLWVM